MTISRASRAYSSLGRIAFRRAGTQSRTQAWRQSGRRQYATEHAKKSSEIPWIVGSVGFTVPAAVWLLGQGPKKSEHGATGHQLPDDSHDEHKAEDEDEKSSEEEPSSEEATQEPEDEKASKDDEKEPKDDEKESKESSDDSEQKEDDSKTEAKDDSKEDSKDDSKDDKSDDSSSESGDEKDTPATSDDESTNVDESEKPSAGAPGQINSSSDKGPGEGQKAGTRKPQETQRERGSKKDESGAKNPYLDDTKSYDKSEKAEGVRETAKIHGTVDPNRPAK